MPRAAQKPPFERYSFVAVTTRDLRRARAFWVTGLGCRVTEDNPGHHFIVDAGGLRLCVDLADGKAHRGGSDPIIGLKVASLSATLAVLDGRGIKPVEIRRRGARGSYAHVHDPDGRSVILTESD